MKEQDEIEKMRDDASDACNKRSSFPGMTFEEGVRAALEWVLGDAEENPLTGE